MKKIFSLGLILTASFLLSACSLPQKNGSDQSSNSNQEAQEFSLKDLITKNIPQRCTWSVEEEGNISSGEILVKGNKFKQTINTKSEEGEMKINAISDGQYIYTWNDKSDQGNFAMKMKIDDSDSSDDTTFDNSISPQVDMDQKQKFNCVAAIVSDADFQIPQDVEFTDYSQFIDQMKSSIPSMDMDEIESE